MFRPSVNDVAGLVPIVGGKLDFTGSHGAEFRAGILILSRPRRPCRDSLEPGTELVTASRTRMQVVNTNSAGTELESIAILAFLGQELTAAATSLQTSRMMSLILSRAMEVISLSWQ